MYRTVYKTETGKWRAEVHFTKEIRRTKTFEKKNDATKWAQNTERDLILNDATQKALKSKIVLSLDEALRRYAEEESVHKKTAKKEIQRIKYFRNNLPNIDWPLNKYQPEFLKEWENTVMKRSIKPLSAGSVLRDYSTLSAFFNWCKKDKGWIEYNPVEQIRKPKKPEHRVRRTDLTELQKMLAALKYVPGTVPTLKIHEVALIWLIAMSTGMRSGEIVNRPVEDVFLDKRYIYLPDTKNGSARIVPMDETALELWTLAMQIKRKNSPKVFTVSDSSRDTLFRKARKQAGLENADLTFHDSRHEAASLMARRVKNALTLCKIFGWKDPKQALTYYNPTNDEILEELNKTVGLKSLLY